MPSNTLITAFQAFRNDCIWLQTVYNMFASLYQSGDAAQSEIMVVAAPAFFADLNLVLLDYFVLLVCRITDPAVTGKSSNLTVSGINEFLRSEALLTPEIEAATKRMESYRSLLADARNKLVAHADLQTIKNELPLGAHTDEDRDGFFTNLYFYVDEVGRAVGEGPLDFRCTAAVGDTLDLVRCLKAGVISASGHH